MGDLFTLPPDIDTQVSPLYKKKVGSRVSNEYKNSIADTEAWANSYVAPPSVPQPTTPTAPKRGWISDSIRAVPAGALDATREMAFTLHDIKNWASAQLYDKTNGALSFGYTPTNETARKNAKEYAGMSESQTVPGELIRGISEFATGFYTGGRVLRPLAAATGLTTSAFVAKNAKTALAIKGAAQGAFADATAFDPHQERLSNLVEEADKKFGIDLSNPISNYLAADKEDSAAEGRFKNALEGLGLGVAVEGLFHGVKLLKLRKGMKPEVKEAFDDALREANADIPTDTLAGKVAADEHITKQIEWAGNAAKQEEQRLLEWQRGKEEGVQGADFTMKDSVQERGFTLPEEITPLRPEERQVGQIEYTPQKQIDYKPSLEPVGKPIDTPLEKIIADTNPNAGQLGDAIPGAKPLNATDTISGYVRSLGHKSVDGFLESIQNNKGFTKQALMQNVAGGGAGAVVGGKVDVDGDGEITWKDVAAGFVMGVGLVNGGKFIAKKLAEGKTEAQAFKELTTEKVAELDSVVSKIKTALGTGTLDEKTTAKLVKHLETLEQFKGQVKGLKNHKEIVTSIKDDTVRAGYKDSVKPIVSFKENPEKIGALQEALLNGDRATVSEGLDVNWKYVDTEDEIQNIVNLTAEKMGTVKDAVRSEAQVKELADELGFTEKSLEALKAANKGTQNLDSKLFAIRGLLVKSAEELKVKAELAMTNPTTQNMLDLRKQLMIHTGIQRSLSQTRTEVGRALRSFQMMSESLTNGKDLDGVLAQMGGMQKNSEAAQHVLDLIKNGDQRGLNQYARAIDGNPKLNALLEYYINSLLSSPATSAVNITTNLLTTAIMPGERMLAGVISKLKGGEARQFRQAQAQITGMVEGIKDAWKMAGQSWRADEALLDPLTKIEGIHYKAISSDALSVAPESTIGKAIDFLGTIVRIPGRALTAGDEFFKTINYRMALNEQIFNSAVTKLEIEQGLTGDALAKAMADEIVNLRNNVPTSIMDSIKGNLIDSQMHETALATARYNTFTQNLNPGLQGIQRAINDYPLAKIIVPFFKVPVNILKYAHERTPLINLWSKEIRDSLTHADPAVRETAQAKLAMGSMVYATGGLLASQGMITGRNIDIGTGEKDSSAKDIAGVPPYSIKIGKTWYSYNRLDPLGMMLGLTADMADIMGKVGEAEATDLAVAGIASIAKNVTSKTYLQGIANFMEIMDSPSEAKIQRFMGNLLGTAVPSAAFAAVKLTDPVAREAHDLVDYLYKRTPGLSTDLPPVRNIFGEAVTLKPGYGLDIMSPVYTSKETDDPTKQEFMRLGISSMNTMKDMKKIQGIELTPEQHDKYVRYMGEPLKKALDKLIASPRYERMSETLALDIPGGKATAIQTEISRYKHKAQVQLIKEYPDLKAQLQGNKKLTREGKKANSQWFMEQIGGND